MIRWASTRARWERLPRWAKIPVGATAAWIGFKLVILLSLVVYPLPTDLLMGDFSTLHLGKNGELLRITLSPREQYRIQLPLIAVGDDLKRGFVRYEDKWFWFHPGINPVAVWQSLVANTRAGRVVRGASTIPMQIAKIMEPKRRTVWGKLREVVRALQLETRYSKKRLLEIYLNSVPMGGNIQGVGAASYLYFGKAPSVLSVGESAMLIALPRSPNLYRPDRNAAQAFRQKGKILSLIGARLGLPPAEIAATAERPVPSTRRANPFQYPHLVVRLGRPATGSIRRYTIDPQLQGLCEDALRQAVSRLESQNVHNGAVIVVDNRTMDVLAYVGSPNFRDARHHGEINGANIARSPGSLLKPFLYATAIEKGLITPKTLVYDIERNYDGYIPANFDRHYRGPVSVEDALVGSLNVPAVNLEYELGGDGLRSFLRKTGVQRAREPADKTGLSLVLGAYPLTLEEMVRLYAMLASDGRLRELRFQADSRPPETGIRLFSPATCYLVANMLTKLERPDLPQSWEFTSNRGRIAFKTGTSFGLRDAWSIGYNPHYTVGVWLGNADAKSSSALIGIKAAAPVVVSIFNHLSRTEDVWFAKPEGMAERTVCAVSGEPVSEACSANVTDLYLPGVSRSEPCSIHRLIQVRRSDGAQVCSTCMTESRSHYNRRSVEVWPPDVSAFLRTMGKRIAPLPKHNPTCTASHLDQSLKLKSPLPSGFYAVTRAVGAEQQKILLQAYSQRASGLLFWYLNDRLIAQGPPDKTFFVDAIPGRHRLTVMNTWGDSDSVTFFVRRRM